jgi:hypothetical protein
MKVATTVLLVMSIVFTMGGLIPCLGWINWFGVPAAGATAILGIIGLATEKDPITGKPDSLALYICALIFGLMMATVGFLRCSAGGGLV